MGDLHQVVVDNVCQVVGRQLVGTLEEHLVVDDVGLHTHLAANEVVDKYLAARLNTETHDILVTGSHQRVDFLLGQRQRVAHLTTGVGVVLEVLYLCTFLFQLLGRIKSDVGLAGVEQLLHILLIDVAALALAIRSFVATKRDSLVELDTQPAERLDDILLGTGHEAVRVGVLNTEHQVATVLTGKQIIIQGGTDATDMQSPRRTRGKTHSNSSF